MKRFLFLLTCSLFVFGGNDRGNGGSVVWCRYDDGALRFIQTMDYYVATHIAKLNLSLGSKSLSAEQKVDLVLNRLAQFDPKRASRFRAHVNSFWSEALLYFQTNLPLIHDFGYVPVFENCQILQVIIQDPSPRDPKHRYSVNMSLWASLDEETKAGLLLHEVIYRDLLEQGHRNSILARYYINTISTERFADMCPEKYEQLIKKIGLERAEGNTAPVWANEKIRFELCENEPFALPIRNLVSDPDSDSLRLYLSQIRDQPKIPATVQDSWNELELDSNTGVLKGPEMKKGKVGGTLLAWDGTVYSATTLEITFLSCKR